MHLLIPLTETTNYKSRDKLPLECEYCHATFFRSKHDVQWALKSNSKTKLRFCKTECAGLHKRTGKYFCCKQCNASTYKTPDDLKGGKLLFCSRSCAAIWYNAHKVTGCRRSKLEKWIEECLAEKYPTLHIDYNKTTAINSELDIFIPSLKLAFELNGIFHYEPIYGKEKLQKTQTNDERKFQACSEKGISLCVLDTHHSKYLKTGRDIQYLNIITQIIDGKMALYPRLELGTGT